MQRKMTIVGAGNVGASVAQRLAEKELADIVLVDVVEGLPQGKALDLLEASPVAGYAGSVIGANDYTPTRDSDIVIITAGIARKPGMSRDDLLKTNTGIVQGVAREIRALSPRAIVIVVSNPLDAMCYVTLRVTGFPRERVLGMAGVLDSARLRTFLAQELRVDPASVQAMVLGGHGDTMVPLIRYCTVGGIPISELLPATKIDQLIQRTREGGAEIVRLLKTGSAYYAPSAAVAEMVDAVVFDRHRILPCSVYLQGEYGLKDVFVGVPVKLGARGLEQIISVSLTPEERAALIKSAQAVQELQTAVAL